MSTNTPSDLAEIFERIQFSRTEINLLKQEVSRFCEANFVIIRDPSAPSVLRRPHDAEQDGTLIVRQSTPVSISIKSRTGAIIHELRSCLDSLACALAIRNGKTSSQTSFPVSKTKAVFESDGLNKLKKLSSTDRETIAALGPYRENNPTLFGLHELDRTRKHIRLTGFGGINRQTIVGNNDFVFEGQSEFQFSNVIIGGVRVERMNILNGQITDECGTGKVVASGVPRNLNLQVETGVAFTEPDDLKNREIIKTLYDFADEVADITSRFVRSFMA